VKDIHMTGLKAHASTLREPAFQLLYNFDTSLSHEVKI